MTHPTFSLAIHSGKIDYVPLLENLLKSFLICNEYPSVELILIESAQNQPIRDWFKSIDFESNFQNFDGKITGVRANKRSKIKKTLLFLDYEETLPWFTCYMDSMNQARMKASGKYFAFLAEDNQFVCKGDVIDDYVNLIQELGQDSHMINLAGMQCYKYAKDNNRYLPMSSLNYSSYFECVTSKWDPTYFCDMSLFKKLGPPALSVEEDPHRTINHYTFRSRDLGIKRSYKLVPAAVWFHNEKRDEIIEIIQTKTRENPDYVLFNIQDYDKVKRSLSELKDPPARPLGTDDWFNAIN